MKIKKNKYRWLYLISAAEMLIFLCLMPIVGRESSDTITYFSAFDTICSGTLDSFRTPVYPLFIGTLRYVFGTALGRIIACLIQIGVFLLSISWFRNLAGAIVKNERLTFWLTAFYALYPGPLTLNCCLLTESFALSGITGLLWLSYKVFTRSDVRAAFGASITLLLLIFLRPAFVFLPVLMGFFGILALFRHSGRKACGIYLAGCVLSIGMLVAYSMEIKRLYNVMSPSTVSSCNNYFTIRGANLVNTSTANIPPELTAAIDSVLTSRPEPGSVNETWTEIKSLRQVATTAQIADYISATMQNNPKECLRYLVSQRLADAVKDDAVYGGYVFPPVRFATKLFSPNIAASFAIVLIFIIILGRGDYRRRKISLPAWLLPTLYLAMAGTSIIGAQDEWQRLILPAYPALLIMAGAVLMAAASSLIKDKTGDSTKK